MIAPTTAAALDRASLAGPYFAITQDPDELLWRPFAELLDPSVLSENVAQVQRVLQERTGASIDDLDLRACASIHALGLASRLVAPALAGAALAGHVPTLAIDQLRWQRVAGGPVPVAVAAATGRDVTGLEDASEALDELVIAPSVTPLIEAFEQTFTLSPQVLWGNVASAVAGAATMLRHLDCRLDARSLAQALTARGGPVHDMGDWTEQGFVRRNCCLFYKIPGGGTCGDCVLRS